MRAQQLEARLKYQLEQVKLAEQRMQLMMERNSLSAAHRRTVRPPRAGSKPSAPTSAGLRGEESWAVPSAAATKGEEVDLISSSAEEDEQVPAKAPALASVPGSGAVDLISTTDESEIEDEGVETEAEGVLNLNVPQRCVCMSLNNWGCFVYAQHRHRCSHGWMVGSSADTVMQVPLHVQGADKAAGGRVSATCAAPEGQRSCGAASTSACGSHRGRLSEDGSGTMAGRCKHQHVHVPVAGEWLQVLGLPFCNHSCHQLDALCWVMSAPVSLITEARLCSTSDQLYQQAQVGGASMPALGFTSMHMCRTGTVAGSNKGMESPAACS
jgi:hypothetical protein